MSNSEKYKRWADELTALEDQIMILQEAKKEIYSSIRESHDRATSIAMKAALRYIRMSVKDRAEADKIDQSTLDIIAAIKSIPVSSSHHAEHSAPVVAEDVAPTHPGPASCSPAVTEDTQNSLQRRWTVHDIEDLDLSAAA